MNNNRREFMKKTATVAALAPPTVTLLISALNPTLALGYGRGVEEPRDLFWGDALTEPWTKPDYTGMTEVFPDGEGNYNENEVGSQNIPRASGATDSRTTEPTNNTSTGSSGARYRDSNHEFDNSDSTVNDGSGASQSTSPASRMGGSVGNTVGSNTGGASYRITGNGSPPSSRGGHGTGKTSIDEEEDVFLMPGEQKTVNLRGK